MAGTAQGFGPFGIVGGKPRAARTRAIAASRACESGSRIASASAMRAVTSAA